MFVKRLISGVVLLIIALVTVNMGGLMLWAVNLFISLVGMMEMYRVFQVHKKSVCLMGYGLIGFYYIFLWFQISQMYILGAGVLAFLLIMSLYVITFPRLKTEDVMTVCFGGIYPGVLLSFLYLTRQMPEGNYLVWLIFLSSWGNDTCAYCVGMVFKKLYKTHQMAPVLSPKKSVEGGVGGIVGAALLGALYGAIFSGKLTTFSLPAPVACGLLCLSGGIISMIGDLAASAIKRNHNVKDYGNWIPGHGGIMDRFDSIVFCAPVLYFVAYLLQRI